MYLTPSNPAKCSAGMGTVTDAARARSKFVGIPTAARAQPELRPPRDIAGFVLDGALVLLLVRLHAPSATVHPLEATALPVTVP